MRLEPRVLALDPFADFRGLDLKASIDEAIEALNEHDGAVRVALRPSIHEDTEEYFEKLAHQILRYVRNALFVVDEITLYSGPEGTKVLRKLVLQGRRLGIRIAVACQQIQLVPRVVLSQCTQMILFNTIRPQDLALIEDWVGKPTAHKLPELAQGQAYLVEL